MSEFSQQREGSAFLPPSMPPGAAPMPPNMRQGGQPPLPPGIKLPQGMQMKRPPMPPGVAPMPPGAAPMPPNMRQGGQPPLPPGIKLPQGMQIRRPPMPPGVTPMPPGAPPMPPGVAPMPPNMRQGGQPPLPPNGGGVGQGQMPPTNRYPQPPPHLLPRLQGDREQGHTHHHQQQHHMMPPGLVRSSNDMYSMRDDRRGVPPSHAGGDAQRYSDATVASSYPQGMYGAGVMQDDGTDYHHRGGNYPQKARREDDLREPTNTVWVGNMDMYEHTDAVLRREFSQFGRVMRIAKVPDKSYCFVHFRHVEEAKNAVETLTSSGSLGRARFNYGKMFDYPTEELDLPQETNNQRQLRRGREEERHEYEDRRRRLRRDEERIIEPTNVLWLGDLPSTLSTEELRENFKVFGKIINISRLDARNMAFIHFETVESCTQALDLMRDQLIGGARVALNYGRAQRPPTITDAGPTQGGIPANETPTNVVYLGQFASDVTEEDIEKFFEPFEGFINFKFIPNSGIAFGHFDTVEHALAARVALSNCLLKGSTVRISFGKSNHTLSTIDRTRRGAHAPPPGDPAAPPAPPVPAVDGISGALVAGPGASANGGGAVVALPAMGVMAGTQPPTAPAPQTCFARERPVPDVTLEARLQSLLGATYNNCGEADKSLIPSVIQTICDLTDDCVDEKSLKRLDDAIFLYTPLNAAHVFGILTKRTHDYFDDDPHKKLLILYAATRVLLGAKTDYLFFTKASLNAYLMILYVASKGQTRSGMEMVTAIIENIRGHPFIERQKLDGEYVELFREQLDGILMRAKEEQDLSSLLSRKRRK